MFLTSYTGKAYTLANTDRTPSFSGKAADPYEGSTKQNSDGTSDTFDKVSSGPDKITLKIEKLKKGESPNSANPTYLDYLTKEYTLAITKDTANDEKYTRFYITTPFPLVDGYYKVSLKLQDQAGNTEAEKEKIKKEGYTVKVKVVDENRKPVKGAKVTLHSTPREAITDKKGVATFTNVAPGEHKAVILVIFLLILIIAALLFWSRNISLKGKLTNFTPSSPIDKSPCDDPE